MPRYADGQDVQLGDKVYAKIGWHDRHVVGTVVELADDELSQCKIAFAGYYTLPHFKTAEPGDCSLDWRMFFARLKTMPAVIDTATGTAAIIGEWDFCQTRNMQLVARGIVEAIPTPHSRESAPCDSEGSD